MPDPPRAQRLWFNWSGEEINDFNPQSLPEYPRFMTHSPGSEIYLCLHAFIVNSERDITRHQFSSAVLNHCPRPDQAYSQKVRLGRQLSCRTRLATAYWMRDEPIISLFWKQKFKCLQSSQPRKSVCSEIQEWRWKFPVLRSRVLGRLLWTMKGRGKGMNFYLQLSPKSVGISWL